MRVAIVYDRVNKWGGAERVLLALNEIFPQADLFTSLYSSKHAPWAKVFPSVKSSFLQHVTPLLTKHEYIPFLMPIAFEGLRFSNYDLVISITSECAKGIITPQSTKHICYCLTPTRYIWSAYNDYFPNSLKRKMASPLVSYLRRWDVMAAQRPDYMISISNAVKRRIKHYYKRSSVVVHPPVDIETFKSVKLNKPRDKFFLVVSRLVPYKKVDLVVKAFNELELPLIVIGSGVQQRSLKSIARRNITFLEKLTDEQLRHYYSNAQALIFPQEEDFGLVAVEAQAAGTPVIAYKKGGVLDIITQGVTGSFFDKQSVVALKYAITTFKSRDFDTKKIIDNAERFSKERFKKKFKKAINL